jgi:hypothetical protein
VFWVGAGRERAYLTRLSLFGLLLQPRMMDDECGPVSGFRIGGRKCGPVQLYPLQIPYGLTWD